VITSVSRQLTRLYTKLIVARLHNLVCFSHVTLLHLFHVESSQNCSPAEIFSCDIGSAACTVTDLQTARLTKLSYKSTLHIKISSQSGALMGISSFRGWIFMTKVNLFYDRPHENNLSRSWRPFVTITPDDVVFQS